LPQFCSFDFKFALQPVPSNGSNISLA
jgi:hypothetical protein